MGTSVGKIFLSTDGGATFNLLETFPEQNNEFADLQFLDINTGYCCYDNKVYKTTDGGITWNTVATIANDTVVEIYFKDASHGKISRRFAQIEDTQINADGTQQICASTRENRSAKKDFPPMNAD